MATSRIKLSMEEMRLIALFENITGATANDCVIDSDRVIFIAKAGEMGLAIGKGGKNINALRNMTGKPIEVVEFADTVEGLVKSCLAPAKVKEVRITERPDRKIVVVEVEPKDKALAIGKNGRTIDKTRMLTKRYYQVDHVQIA
jgi:N utilization substance protein A